MKNPITLLLALLFCSAGFAQNDSLSAVQAAQPLTVAAFAVKPVDRNIQLTWSVTGNEDAKSFVVERSDASHGWVKIGGKMASGKVGTAGYEFIDAMPRADAVYSYRLVAIGKDGSALYSVSQGASVPNGFAFGLKQNPVKSTLELEAVTSSPASLQLTVLTAYGQKVATQTVKAAGGRSTVSVSAAGLASGLYRLVVETGGQSQVISFVKE